MAKTLQFNAEDFRDNPGILILILNYAERWKCTPGEALKRLLKMLAEMQLGAVTQREAVAGA